MLHAVPEWSRWTLLSRSEPFGALPRAWTAALLCPLAYSSKFAWIRHPRIPAQMPPVRVALCLVLLFGGDVQGLVLSRSPRVARRCAAPRLQQEPAGRTSEAVRDEATRDFEGKVVPTGQGQVVPPEDATDEPTGYVAFAQNYPFANNIMIATAKTAAAAELQRRKEELLRQM